MMLADKKVKGKMLKKSCRECLRWMSVGDVCG